jgi:hypothetical protein
MGVDRSISAEGAGSAEGAKGWTRGQKRRGACVRRVSGDRRAFSWQGGGAGDMGGP